MSKRNVLITGGARGIGAAAGIFRCRGGAAAGARAAGLIPFRFFHSALAACRMYE